MNTQMWNGVISNAYVTDKRVTCDFIVLAGSVYRDIPLYQQFGVSSLPPAGTEGILVPLGADMDDMVCIATGLSEKGSDPQPGQVVVASDSGSEIRIGKGFAFERGETEMLDTLIGAIEDLSAAIAKKTPLLSEVTQFVALKIKVAKLKGLKE